MRGQGHPRRVHHQRRLRRGRRRRHQGTGRAGGAGRGTRACSWPVRTGKVSCRPRPICAPRSWPRTRRADRSAWPASPATSSAPSSTGRYRPVSASAERSRPATQPRSASPTISTSTHDDATKVGLAYVEGIDDGRGVLRIGSVDRQPEAVRRGQGRGNRRRRPGRRQSHRLARLRRPGVRRRHAPGRRHPGRDCRGSVRGRSHVRNPTAPEGQPGGRHDHRRRLGRRHRRRDPSECAGARDPSRGPAGTDRHEAATSVEPEQPRRSRRWRDPGHDSRGDGR